MDQFYLNIISSLAVKDTLEVYLPEDLVKVKWPNDVYAGSKKISGILIQNTIREQYITASIVGIGINVNQEYFNEKKATSLKLITGQAVSLQDVFQVLLINIEKYYMWLKEGALSHIKSKYVKSMYGLYERKKYMAAGQVFEGMITGIDQQGRLELTTESGPSYFGFKELSFL